MSCVTEVSSKGMHLLEILDAVPLTDICKQIHESTYYEARQK